jgi:hypothetical protein
VRYKCTPFGELNLDEAMGMSQDRLSNEQTQCSDSEAKRHNNYDACHLVVWPEQYLYQTFLEEISQKNNLESGIRGKHERGFNKIDHGNVTGSELDPVVDKQQKETRSYVVLFYVCKYCLERFGSTKKQKLSLV